MSEPQPFVGEIRIFACWLAPRGWAHCNGQLLPISQNTALFALLGPNYGGDGKSTFALPDLRGRVPVHTGQGPGLSERFYAESGGQGVVTLLQSEMPAHNHTMQALNGFSASNDPTGRLLARPFGGGLMYAAPDGQVTALDPAAIAPAGGSVPHNNMMPFQALNFCIALQGVFPART